MEQVLNQLNFEPTARSAMRRPQFTLRAMLVLMLAVGCFFAGIRFERELRRHADEAAARHKGYVDTYLQIELSKVPDPGEP